MALSNRDETIKKFSNGEIQILITRDLLSRGYDEKSVKLVINFDLPIKKAPDGNIIPNYEAYFIEWEELGNLELEEFMLWKKGF